MARENMPQCEHPADEALCNLFIDDTPDAGAHRAVRHHLENCSLCRQRFSQMQEAMASFEDYHSHEYSVERRPPPGRWLAFRSKLRRQAREHRAESLIKASWPRWVAGIAACLALTFLLIRPSQALSASEVLRRCAAAEKHAGGLPQPLMYRKFRVDSAAGAAHWEVWYAPIEKRVHDRWSGNPQVSEELRAIYLRNHLSPDLSLSPLWYQQWHERTQPAKDEVNMDESKNLVIVSTTRLNRAQAGDIIQTELVLRRSDWHAIEQGFKVQTDQGRVEYRVREVAYRAEPFTPDAWASIEPKGTASAIAVSAGQSVDAGAPRNPVDLDASEIRVLAALRKAELDVTTDFEIRRGENQLELLVFAPRAGQRAAVRASLAGIPEVSVQFPVAAQSSMNVDQGQPESAEPALPPLMLRQLSQALGSDQASEECIAGLNEAFITARAHALALAHLVHTNAQRGNAWTTRPDLTPLAAELARDHARTVLKETERMRELLNPVAGDWPLRKAPQECRVWDGGLSSLPQLISDAQRVSDRLFSVSRGPDQPASMDEFKSKITRIWSMSEVCAR